MGQPETARRGPYAKTAGRVEDILDAAQQLFAAHGYRATTMRQLAERVGMSQTGLMHHFPGKADVLIALLRRREATAFALRPAARELPPVERLLLVADDIQHDPVLAALHTVLAAEAIAPDHPAHEFMRQRYAQVRERLTASLADWQRDGGLRADVDPASLARLTIGVLDGLQQQWLYDPDSVDIRAELHTFVSAWTV